MDKIRRKLPHTIVPRSLYKFLAINVANKGCSCKKVPQYCVTFCLFAALFSSGYVGGLIIYSHMIGIEKDFFLTKEYVSSTHTVLKRSTYNGINTFKFFGLKTIQNNQ